MWDRNQIKLLQAISCIGVILHHLTQDITSYGSFNRGPITVFSSMGILFTSVFFFSTGFGLITSVLNRPDYLDTFLCHRLSTVLIPFFTANTVFVLLRIYYSGVSTSPVDILRCIFGLVLLNGNGWYIVEVFYLYIIFYILFRLIKKKDIAIILLCIASFLMIRYAFHSGHDYSDIGGRHFRGEWWYNSTIVFSMGVIFARFKDPITSFIKKIYRFLLPVTAVLFVIAFRIEEKILKTHGYYRTPVIGEKISDAGITLIAQMILCIISTFLILLINMKISLGNRVLKGISVISTELFLIHGAFRSVIFDFSKTGAFRMYAVVISASIVAATVMHYINMPLIALIQYRKDGKKLLTKTNVIRGAVAAGIIAAVYFLFTDVIFPPFESRSEISALKNAKEGDVVSFGRYESDYGIPGKEHLTWIVLKIEDGKVMLISEKGIAGSSYNKKHMSVDWNGSDIRELLNGDMYDKMFSRYEKKHIVGGPGSSDSVTLLTVEEATALFPDDLSRQLAITEATEKDGTNINRLSKVHSWDMVDYRSSWWWLKGEEESFYAPIVTVDGDILTDEKEVNKPSGAIRPVIWVEVN